MKVEVGDQFLVKFEVVDIGSYAVSVRPLNRDGDPVSGASNGFDIQDIDLIVREHVPKPVEPVAGQVWGFHGQSDSGYRARTAKILWADGLFVLYENDTTIRPVLRRIDYFKSNFKFLPDVK